MEILTLKEVEVSNTETLKKYFYPNKTVKEVENIILTWKDKSINGKYFEMLGIFNDNQLVGVLSLVEQTKNTVSLGIEIFEYFRKLGYGYLALNKGLEKAKQQGYKMTVNQVRTDNIASIALCKKCGLESNFYEYVNKKSNKVYIYVKNL